ncbi:LamG domain-containing protein [Pyxidicoccus sp. 3LFB2]
MARAFDITTTSPALRLDGSRRGEVSFTVTNSLGQPVRGRAVIVPEGGTPPEWFSLTGESERDFPRDGTHVFHVKASVPASQAAGEHAFHLLVVDQANPDEHFADGPTVSVRVPAPLVIPRRRIPWWMPVSALAALLVIILASVLWNGGEDAGTGGSGPVVEPEPEPKPPPPVLTFNGTTAYVDLGEPLPLEISGPVTLEAWVRPTNINGIQNIIARGYVLNPTGEVYLRILFGSLQVGSYMDGKQFANASGVLPTGDANQWIHVAGVHDGQKWMIYRNGELLGEAAQPGGGALPIRARWAIGAKGGGSERGFNGNIRDVRIWSVARTPAQIKEDMNNPPGENAEGLVGYWPMDEGRARRIVDRSGNEAHGFVHDAQWTAQTPPEPQTPPPPQTAPPPP